MEVKIISKEIIKPSLPTPPHLKTYKLSLLDQLAPQLYIPIILFYSPPPEISTKKTSEFLKKSLSESLTKFYPLAGQIRNDWSCVDCNDHGVPFLEVAVVGDMSKATEEQNTINLQDLLPCKPHEIAKPDSTSQELLVVQANYFGCGGIGIGVCIWHEIGDASSLGSFVNTWGEISSGAIDNNSSRIDGFVIDCRSIFPPQDSEIIKEAKLKGVASENGKKKFVLNGENLVSLKEKIEFGATRFEAASALIWGAVMATIKDKNGMKIVNSGFPVNLRKKMDPPLQQHCLGNIVQATLANWPDQTNEAEYGALARIIRASKEMMNDDFIRKFHSEGGYLNALREIGKKGGFNTRIFSLSSWCGFPFYEADFGWGKPIWICPAMSYDDSCIFTDTRDGKGIEAWIGLPKEDMEKFLQHPGIITYTSFSQNNIS